LSGEALAEAIDCVLPHSPRAVLVNCLPPSAVDACLPVLRKSGIAFGVYANLGEPDSELGFERREDCDPSEFEAYVAGWISQGARLVGGCCGTTPHHIRAIARALAGK
jgi:homocysteine S-methyltransferase